MAGTNINRVILTGNLTRDPELSSLPSSGMAVCSLRVACNGRRKNNQTGEWEDQPNYFDVTVFGAQGENCSRYLRKGRPVAGRSARQSISSLSLCSSSVRARMPGAGTGSPVASVQRRATSRSIPVISRARRRPPGPRTKTSRSRYQTTPSKQPS